MIDKICLNRPSTINNPIALLPPYHLARHQHTVVNSKFNNQHYLILSSSESVSYTIIGTNTLLIFAASAWFTCLPHLSADRQMTGKGRRSKPVFITIIV
ncbi:hypothetical protein FJZ31_41495 [Candidatus Poribacteria bacterium]|nr:hypothetical protein [Candidatus Poribacteria bacterium]